jgi:hypothetical protein
MIIPDTAVLQSLNELSQSGGKNWTVFCEWLELSLSGQTTMLISMDDERQSAIFTGRCRELRELSHFITRSKFLLEERKSTHREPMMPMTIEEAMAVID